MQHDTCLVSRVHLWNLHLEELLSVINQSLLSMKSTLTLTPPYSEQRLCAPPFVPQHELDGELSHQACMQELSLCLSLLLGGHAASASPMRNGARNDSATNAAKSRRFIFLLSSKHALPEARALLQQDAATAMSSVFIVSSLLSVEFLRGLQETPPGLPGCWQPCTCSLFAGRGRSSLSSRHHRLRLRGGRGAAGDAASASGNATTVRRPTTGEARTGPSAALPANRRRHPRISSFGCPATPGCGA